MQARKSNAILICDEGNEVEFRKRIRRMGVYNPIPSNQGTWGDTDEFTKNIPLDFIVEDPIFKKSHESHFIQMVIRDLVLDAELAKSPVSQVDLNLRAQSSL
jgi:hypothetical protein